MALVVRASVGFALLLMNAACGGAESGTTDESETAGSQSASSASQTSATDSAEEASTSVETSGATSEAESGDGDGDADSGDGDGDGEVGQLYYEDDFEGLANGTPWPAPWVVAPGSNPVAAEIRNGQACLEGNVFSGMDSGEGNLARMIYEGAQAQDFDARFDVSYGNFNNQGIGFYVRQNGGFFTLSPTPGEGYVVFIEGYSADALTLWYEDDGDEIEHEIVGLGPLVNVDPATLTTPTFSVRYRLETVGDQSIQRAKVWMRDTQQEPADWQIVGDEVGIDSTDDPTRIPSLQGVSGVLAIDLFNSSQSGGSACFDNIVVHSLDGP